MNFQTHLVVYEVPDVAKLFEKLLGYFIVDFRRFFDKILIFDTKRMQNLSFSYCVNIQRRVPLRIKSFVVVEHHLLLCQIGVENRQKFTKMASYKKTITASDILKAARKGDIESGPSTEEKRKKR